MLLKAPGTTLMQPPSSLGLVKALSFHTGIPLQGEMLHMLFAFYSLQQARADMISFS